MFTLGHHADPDGYVALARATIAGETRLSEITVKRTLDRLTAGGEVAEVTGEAGPSWWRTIRPDRRPRLLRLSLFAATRTGARGGPPPEPTGARRGRDGGARQDADQPLPAQNVERRTEEPISELPLGQESSPSEPEAPKRRRARTPRDDVWDAVVQVSGLNPTEITKPQQGRIARAVADLVAVGATPDEIRRRASVYRGTFPGAALTPTALSSNWASLTRPLPAEQPTNPVAQQNLQNWFEGNL
jgi:hypothetical protein